MIHLRNSCFILIYCRLNIWDSPTSWNNNQAAFLDRLVSAGSKNGFRVLADDAKIGRTGAKYLIIFGARQRRLLPAHPRARGNIIPPSSPRPLRGRAERRWGERNLLLAVPLSLHRKRDTNHTIAVAGCWPTGGARKCTSTSLQMVDPFPPAFYTESGKGTLETTRYICTKSWGNKISNIPPHHRKLCVVCVTPLGYSLARFVSTIVDGRRGKQKQGMMMKAL